MKGEVNLKFSELAKYCESINVDCDNCKNKEHCKRMVSYVEDQSPYGVLKTVKEDKEF